MKYYVNMYDIHNWCEIRDLTNQENTKYVIQKCK